MKLQDILKTKKEVEADGYTIVNNIINEGRQDFWKCKQYEMDEGSKEIFARLSVLMNDE